MNPTQNHKFITKSPVFLEKSLLKTVPKRSLSPYLQRKIHEKSRDLFKSPRNSQNFELSPRNIQEKSALPYFLPAVFKKDEAFLRKMYEKQVNSLIISQKNRAFSPNSAKISWFSEKISRLVAKNQQKIDEHGRITKEIKEIHQKSGEKTGKLGKIPAKSYEIRELEEKFKKLARKTKETSPKARKTREIH